ncbi:MAG: VTC domain protein [Firmicutes bacterium ADurb.Bin248]|nr:MAG: VTC domain protein [Firmicutes bacterium ADurb.Bin248]HOG00666.1 polyphosphate polymerase domain-containing protein [Clostridia bacterium]HPK15438.1 polyphosphate polymerase domain-containing protein [Clostridia bacterium]
MEAQRERTSDIYRHEVKYYVNARDAHLLCMYLKSIMHVDENADEHGEYWIRSLYFDTAANRDYYEKLGGISERKKFRIRIYDTQADYARLELKSKSGPYVHKQSAEIGRPAALRLANGDFGALSGLRERAAGAFYACHHAEQLRPVILIDYVRKAFYLPFEGIRVTIDRCLQASLEPRALFCSDMPRVPVLSGQARILEVKFYHALPGCVRSVLSDLAPQISSVSKYVLSRQTIHI